ncbi:tartrate-resistant acid phosphatase type 5-like [Lytechinus variegatus]|uniref:tartrate-resistant acid phosphatase type 5-like n=1 Tax=Lytechinus variegatus TaxID=7654 RepID=UPI001BB14788|nr:tartrate-resistant acid phosphatase type 5-like [Lytechinus variegatus]
MDSHTVRASLYTSCILFVLVSLQGSYSAYLGQKNSLNFMVLADWGGQPNYPFYTTCEEYVAKQMGDLASNYATQFVLALGDNFYYDGVQSVTDPRFNETFENVFTADSLQVPWYVVAGNHDWHGNVTAQILYSNVSKRWNFPSLYYLVRYQIPSTQEMVSFIMIDTVSLSGTTDDSNVLQQPTKPKDLFLVEKQFSWIEDQLKATMNDTYVIVAGHYPVWSIAEHGPTELLVDRLRPLLIKYNVNAYFSGHDHNLQHIREDNSSVEYFVIGSAHEVDPSVAHKKDVPENWVKFHYADESSLGGFAYMEATTSGMDFTFADGRAGKSLYHATIKPRKM